MNIFTKKQNETTWSFLLSCIGLSGLRTAIDFKQKTKQNKTNETTSRPPFLEKFFRRTDRLQMILLDSPAPDSAKHGRAS
jgi:hypothetical protein